MNDNWKLNVNLFILAHRSLTEYITKNDKNNYEEFSTFLESLRQKEFDALTGEDSTKLHTYIHFLIEKYLLKHFAAKCLQWPYTVHLVDSSIIKKEIKEGNARAAQRLSALESSEREQFAEIEERLSALESKYVTISGVQPEMLTRVLQI